MSLRDKLLSKPTESTPITTEDLPAVLPPDAPEPAPVQVAPEVAEQAAPKRRGRPRKSPEAEQLDIIAPPVSSSRKRSTLFVDCMPTTFDGPPPMALTAYADRMHRKVAEAGGVDDVRFAGSDSALGFGKWRGALAMAVRAEPPQPGCYFVLGLAQSELMQVIVEALEPSFDVVIRGVR